MQDTVVEGEVEEQSREVEKPCMAGRFDFGGAREEDEAVRAD